MSLSKPPETSPAGTQEPGFEEILARLKELVEQLEGGELPLETAVALFEEGVRLSKVGAQRLDEAELKVEELLSGSKDVQTRPIPKDAMGKP
ncbi:MAG: exodeoxyribonuclease VII small subunit [Myxococcales bacterium]|nr:exodeoxyribonuclease VII small subunit [Myxococcales bacterium]MCB9708850.1 exodeoxyribonuclease VII small subunit [Myxococcales bacterium]